MLHALAHIPPAPPGPPLPHTAEEDELTPPPDLVFEPNMKNQTSRAPSVVNGSPKGESTDGELTPPPAAEPKSTQAAGRGRGKRISYAEEAVGGQEGDEDAEVEEPSAKKTKRTPKKVEDEYEPNGQDLEMDGADEHEDVPAPVTPKKGGRKKAAKVKKESDEDEEEDGEAVTPAKEKKPRKPTPKKSRLAKDEPELDEEGNEIVKKKRKPKVYPKIEYVIPDVPKKTTNFRGQSPPVLENGYSLM
jgi:UV DNA damage endonuclease